MKRLLYVDCLRGFSMILVVYQHIITFGMPQIYPGSPLSEFFLVFRMPLFFFISGFVSYKAINYNFDVVKKQSIKKIFGQLIPTIVFFSLFVFAKNLNLNESIQSSAKQGYWFTLVSFEIYMCYLFYSYIFKVINKNLRLVIFFLLTLFIRGLFAIDLITVNSDNDLLSFKYFVWYSVFFAYGIIVKDNLLVIHKLLVNKYISFILFLLSFVCPFVFNLNEIFYIFPIILCMYYIFYYYKDFCNSDHYLVKMLSYIGKNTLPIYFIHYFLLFRLNNLESYLLSFRNDICFMGTSASWLIEFGTCILISIVLCYVSIFIKKIIDVFPFVSKLCFGPPKD